MASPSDRPDLVLGELELRLLTGCKRPGDQVGELRRLGFFRARRARDGSVVLERSHYHAVTAGPATAANEPILQP